MMAAAWLVIFAVAYLFSRQIHGHLGSKLRILRTKMALNPEASESEVLVRLRQAFGDTDSRVRHQSGLLLEQASEGGAEERIRRCERWWESLRALLEVFPILGILGTVTAMALSADAGTSGTDASGRLTAVMANFGDAMYSTIWGLGSAAVGMLLMGLFAPKIEQWFTDIREFKSLVTKAEHLHHTQAANDALELANSNA